MHLAISLMAGPLQGMVLTSASAAAKPGHCYQRQGDPVPDPAHEETRRRVSGRQG